ncbi:MAG: acyltransferase family protein [Acidimicrobiia bacterium]
MTADAPASVADPEADDRAAFSYRPGLDGLRALSVLAVIAFHEGYSWAVGGFLGVDAFFVLSGFLITTLLLLEYERARHIGLVAFWGRRVRRLLPALLLVLVACAIYASQFTHPFEIEAFRWDSISSLFYVTNWRFIVSGQSYFDLLASPSPVRHLWSLAIEEQFYLVWPLITLGCLHLRKGRHDLLAGVCIVGAIASAIAMAALYDAADSSRAYYGTDTRAHTILIGALLAIALLHWRSIPRGVRLTLQLAGAAALLAIGWSWHTVDGNSSGYYGLGSVAYALGVAIVIAAAVQPEGLLGRALGIGPLKGIGKISYGLYLWHWPVIIWLPYWRIGLTGSSVVAFHLAVTFAAASISYFLVESPIRRAQWFPRRARITRFVVPVAVALAAVVLLAGSVGAEDQPGFMAGFLEPCPAPTKGEIAQSRAYFRDHPVEVAGPHPTIGVIGDSVACSLEPGLRALTAEGGWKFRSASIIGCGVVSNEVLASSAVPVISPRSDRCAVVAADARDFVLAGHPRILLWVSTWERADLVVGGERASVGSPRWNRALQSRMDAVIAQAHRIGAHVVITSMPPHSEGKLLNAALRPSADDADAFQKLNNLLLAEASRHPGEVTLVDFASFVCPGGAPCPRTRDGFAPRAVDGGHYTPTGAAWALDWLLPRVVASTKPVAAGT